MSPAATALSTAAGGALIVLVLLDVFATLFARGRGRTSSQALIRGTWVAFRRLSARPRVLSLAGPVSFLGVVATWIGALVAGWALVYWSRMPEGFLHDAGLDGGADSALIDSVYLSLVTLGTLGYGEITPVEGWLRIVAPLESLLGLGLVAAIVSWLLSIYPVLSRRRALAYEISLLHGRGRDPSPGEPAGPLPARVYAELTSRLVAVERDLVAFPVSYYFHEDDRRFALPATVGYLLDLAEVGDRPEAPAEVRLHAAVLRRAIDDFAASVAERFHGRGEGSTREVLGAYARDHAV
jgi:hypothetical protein